MSQLPDYQPREFEPDHYEDWVDAGLFEADPDSDRPPFCMVIPPPNVTGSLHMGHALNSTLQDVLARWRHMMGDEVLWVPGTDHAGIATQNVVERQIEEEGTDRHELGREAFLERVWDWKQEYGDRIVHQLRALGVSCDWSRERFTMDEGLSNAVKRNFLDLYEDGYIYRGDYIVNWCPRCQTALSDIEVEHSEVDGHWYHIEYPLVDSDDRIRVATTRPETMLGDTGVAFHPSDERYQHLEGNRVRLPLVEREIPIVADDRVDPDFGSGLVKVTPAHDDLDFRIGQDHDLEVVNLLNDDGTFNENAGETYEGLDRYEARDAVVSALDREGYLIEIEDYRHEVGHCYRCDTPVEPYVSKQWFVAMEELAEPAIEAVREGEIEFHPSRWENTYFEWMENIRDWCISRQIWWGHRIPVWYGPDEEIFVAESEEKAHEQAREHYGEPVELTREEDVLDTWFSSALWPFSTLGWPDEESPELNKFYPTDVLSTGFDIIFFWVARMIMMGYYAMDEKPFEDVYIHALIRTEDGRKMSKSLGNVIDPLDMIEEFGCDPLRFTLCALAAQGRDIRLSEDRIRGFRNFANKVWNAARYVDYAAGDAEPKELREPIDRDKLEPVDRWILSRFRQTMETATEALDNYHFDEYGETLYQFVWHEFCDWYIEWSKLRLDGTGDHPEETKKVLVQVLDDIVKALHPVMPYLTEELQDHFRPGSDYLLNQSWPEPPASHREPDLERTVHRLQELTRAGRHLKKEFNVQTDEGVELLFRPEEGDGSRLERFDPYVRELVGLEQFTVEPGADRPQTSTTEVLSFGTVFMPLEGIIDVEREIERIESDLEDRRERRQELNQRLNNPQFLDNAPEDVVEQSKEEFSDVQDEIERLESTLEELASAAPA